MDWIEIEDMEFYAYHGCYPEEQTIGNHFIVSLGLSYPSAGAAASDRIEDALDYVEAYAVVRQIMNEPRHLLEHVAERMLSALFGKFPQLHAARVKISKKNPPVGGKVRCVSVTMERERS